MKKILFSLIVILAFYGVFATTGEVSINSIGLELKEAVIYAFYMLLITIVGILTKYITSAIDSFVESKKGKSYYAALKQAEEVMLPFIAEAEAKLIDEIKKKFPAGSPERINALNQVAGDVLKKTEQHIPDKVKNDLEAHGESVRGILPKLLEPAVRKHKWLGLVDFRRIRDNLNIPKI